MKRFLLASVAALCLACSFFSTAIAAGSDSNVEEGDIRSLVYTGIGLFALAVGIIIFLVIAAFIWMAIRTNYWEHSKEGEDVLSFAVRQTRQLLAACAALCFGLKFWWEDNFHHKK